MCLAWACAVLARNQSLCTNSKSQYHQALHIPKPPKYVAKQYTAKEYKQKQAYNIDKWWYGQANNLFTLALTLASLFGRYMPWLWTRSGQWLALVPALPQNEIMQSIVFFLADSLLRTIISIPWSVYSTFVIEQRHGFNKQTVGTFVSDVVKKVYTIKGWECMTLGRRRDNTNACIV